MKRIAIILTVVAATAMLFSSCGKYEEGPAFSLLTKKARIAGTWNVVETTVNDEVQDMQGATMKITMEKDGTGEMAITWSGLTITSELEWEFDEAKENLRSRTKGADETEFGEWGSSEIIRLTNSECWTKSVETVSSVDVVTIIKMEKE